MTKTKAKQWLKAVRKLSAYYRGEDKEYHNECPFCLIVGHKQEGGWDCQKCLWYIFSKQPAPRSCCSYSCRFFSGGAGLYRQTRDPRWVRLSLKRLSRWEKRLIEICEKEKP